jgi:hypothetical protein
MRVINQNILPLVDHIFFFFCNLFSLDLEVWRTDENESWRIDVCRRERDGTRNNAVVF